MDKVLKRRLIGASILIALAVIFVPMLLVDPDSVDDGSGAGVEIPPMPESAREVRRIPLDPEAARRAGPERGGAEGDQGPAEPTGAPDDASKAGSERRRADETIVLRPDLQETPPTGPDGESSDESADDLADDSPSERPVAESSPRPAMPPESDPASESDAPASPPQDGSSAPEPVSDAGEISLGDWIVQVASFASRDSADQVRDRLEALGHIVARDEIVRGQSLLYRLRTGPYASREAAERALEQISATVAGVEPIVREVDADLRKATDAGFAVQVGSFVSKDNADSETERLTGLGYDAFRFSEEVGERVIWRVMVGPVADRGEANALKARLVEAAGVEGLVVSYP